MCVSEVCYLDALSDTFVCTLSVWLRQPAMYFNCMGAMQQMIVNTDSRLSARRHARPALCTERVEHVINMSRAAVADQSAVSQLSDAINRHIVVAEEER
jgi:hypothetical protein